MSLSQQKDVAVFSPEKHVVTASNEQTSARQNGANADGEVIDMDYIREDIRKRVSKPTVSEAVQ